MNAAVKEGVKERVRKSGGGLEEGGGTWWDVHRLNV